MIRLLYFASLREGIGTAFEEVSLPTDTKCVADLVGWLHMRGDPWATQLSQSKRWRVAINQQMAGMNSPVKAGDEVAFFPPVTGG